ncbi:MAG: stringent starvation protein B, partial [Pseudomonadales bacterium]
MYDWIIDNDLTPYVLVDAQVPGVSVPADYVKDGKIVLNVGPNAVGAFSLNDTALACDCRFGGRAFPLYLPMPSIQAIYAKETGEGMVFEAEAFPTDPTDPDGSPQP